MAFNIKATLEAIASHVSRSGYVNDTMIGEPTSPPEAVDKMMAAVMMNGATIAELTLTNTVEVHTVTVRFYRRAAFGEGDDAGEVETEVALAVSEIASNLIGEYDLGATIRNIDVAGQYGGGMSATWGYINISGTIYRTVDLTVPLVVDDSATQAA
tara:strand:- start:435 stop:902 length:468 start_codon:yes stop_codon:yes gene_type:complete